MSDTPNQGGDALSEPVDYARLYAYRFHDVGSRSASAVWSQIAPFVWRKMGSPEIVLDPAAGRGEFIGAVGARERWLVDAVDYPERAVDVGVEKRIGDIFEVELPDAHFEGIFVSNLLEHFADPGTVARFLAKMREKLAPGGVIAVMGPNFKYCAREYFDCADHTLALTHVSVAEHLAAAGFDVEEVIPRFLPFSFRSRLPASVALTRVYLRVPLLWRLQARCSSLSLSAGLREPLMFPQPFQATSKFKLAGRRCARGVRAGRGGGNDVFTRDVVITGLWRLRPRSCAR